MSRSNSVLGKHDTDNSSLVFGTLYDASDDGQKREPSTVDLLRISRAARKTKAQQPIRERTPAPSFSLRLHSRLRFWFSY